MKKMHIIVIVCAFVYSCAHRISNSTVFDQQKYPRIGYIAFKLLSINSVNILSNDLASRQFDLKVKHIESNEKFVFMLNNNYGPALSFQFGPLPIYTKLLSEKKIPPLSIFPLPEGTYSIEDICSSGQGHACSWSVKDNSFKIQNGLITYIGTYRFTLNIEGFFFPKLQVEMQDDGTLRADSIDLQIQYGLCPMQNPKYNGD